MNHRFKTLLCIGAATATLWGCGGGGGTDGTGAPASVLVTSSGSMTRGSVILNGTRYDDSAATVTDDRDRVAAQLDDGMVVKLRGRSSDDGLAGVAERVDVENEVRATIQTIDGAASPQRFTVAGLVVLVDAQTVYANVAGFAGLTQGSRVEVHGLRDAAGQLRATRVEAVGAGEGVDELRGTVGSPDTAADRFTLNGNVTVNYANATFAPAGTNESSLAAGRVVEVRGSLSGTVFTATQVDFEDLEDDSFRGAANEKQEVEGFVTGFNGHPGSFQVNGRAVQTTASTRFEDGTAADLANSVKVEAEGFIDAQGVLVARKIEFKQARVILHGLATSVSSSTVVVLGQTVRADDLTRIDARTNAGNSGSLSGIAANVDCVEVRGYLDGNSFVAEEIKEPSGCDEDLVQGRVTAENGTTLTFFGGLTATLPANAQFQDLAGLAMTRDAFMAAVVPASAGNAGTLVKVKGRFANGTLTAEEAELED